MTNATSNATETATETASKSVETMKADALLYSAVEYWDIDSVLTDLQNCPSSIHIRGGVENVDQAIIDEKKAALTFDKKILVENPLTVWMADNVVYVLDGNNRLRALRELRESGKALTFADVPIRYLLIDPTPTNLTRLQINANDTTTRHSVIQLAHSVNRLWDSTYANEMSTNGGNDKAAGGKATKACMDVTQKTKAYIGDLRKIATTALWLLDAYDHGLVSIDVILKMTQLSKSVPNLTLETIFKGCQMRLPNATFMITLKIFNEFKTELEKINKAAQNVATTDTSGSTGDTATATNAAPSKPFDKVAALAGIEKTLTAVFTNLEPDSIDTVADEVVYNLAKALGKLNAYILANGFVTVDRASAILEAQKDLTLVLFQDPEMLDKISLEELRSVSGHTQMVDKTMLTLLAVLKADLDNSDEGDETDETDEYGLGVDETDSDDEDSAGYSPDYQGGEYPGDQYEPNGIGDGDHDDDSDLQ